MSGADILAKLLVYSGLNVKSFSEKIGLDRPQALYDIQNGKTKRISSSMANRIASEFSELNLNWLLSGEGEMLKRRKEEAIEINPDIMMVSLVSQYAYGGYQNGYADAEYIETLPTIPVFVDRELKGTYMAFEVRGDSMDVDSRDSICQGDRIICRLIKPDLWKYKFHMRQWNFVIVHKTDGILVKRIIDHDTDTGTITLHSLNPLYEDIKVQLNDVAQMFNVIEIHRGGRI